MHFLFLPYTETWTVHPVLIFLSSLSSHVGEMHMYKEPRNLPLCKLIVLFQL